ncbi:MAG: PEP-CTERM sorting domain-containing protein [candidate division Zixibacteria bacterium]|nr:PEP-CTERM sorting domain-containing protein [candidate division Zixibacteria bacterium]
MEMFNGCQKIVVCLGVLIVSCHCFAQTQLVQNLDNGISQKVLCLGTSNYVNSTPGAGGTWIPQVEQALNALYTGTATFYAEGQSAQNSSRGAEVIGGLMSQYAPDVVVMGFAINDGTGAYDETARRQNIESMVSSIRNYDSNTEIIFFNIISPEDVTGFDSRSLRPNLQAALGLWEDIANENGLLHVNLFDEWESLRVNDPSTYLSYTTEGVHMNPAGNQAITTPEFVEYITTPEPATITLLGLAGWALAGRRKRDQ